MLKKIKLESKVSKIIKKISEKNENDVTNFFYYQIC